MRKLMKAMPPFLAELLAQEPLEQAREIRVREGWPVEVRYEGRSSMLGGDVTQEQVGKLASALTGYSLYAWETQMREGFFTLPGGFRVGLTGRYAGEGTLQRITSLCIRLAREIPDAADALMKMVMRDGRLLSTLILSPPCLGKTTMLRAMIGRLSEKGLCVAVCDERGELGGGILGARADVAALCEKSAAIPRLVRALSPDVVATDELGGERDAQAVAEAARCGVSVLATAHARDYASAAMRGALGEIVRSGVFERYAVLADAPGRLSQVLDGGGKVLWTRGP